MLKVIQVSVITILTSFFFFPFFFSFLPSVNTKMFLAVLGLMAFFMDYMKGYASSALTSLVNISIFALGVSLCSFASMTINGTPDDSYLGYIVSMAVWFFAAYFCVSLIRQVHGHVSVELVARYLMSVALLQCTLALLIDHFPIAKNLVNTYVTGERYMGVGVKNRLYGIGCALDVGGGRLGAVLIAIAYLILQAIKQQKSKWMFLILLSSFICIFIIGNMMGRTATVGAALALVYLVFSIMSFKEYRTPSLSSFLFLSLGVVVVGSLVCIGLYNTNAEARNLLRFGFEAFFNYFEYGEFETHSTAMLSEGMVFPDNLKTWIIGDGYMASGSNDPYYIGPSDYGFYMNTDAGYSRFIFYFGLIGLFSFIIFFIAVCRECINKMYDAKFLFIAILLLNFCIWVKVSTDLFVVFAIFLCVDSEDVCGNGGQEGKRIACG